MVNLDKIVVQSRVERRCPNEKTKNNIFTQFYIKGGKMKRKTKIFSGILGLLMLLVLPFMLQAQITTGTLRGFVTDDTGVSLPGVTIEIESTALMTPRAAVTDARGSYRFLYLPPGRYTICAKLEGFETCWLRGVPVQAAQTSTANVEMKMGKLEKTIEVTAEAPLIDTESSSKTYNIKFEMLKTTPIAPRMNFTDIWHTLPGVRGYGEASVNAATVFQPSHHNQDGGHENKILIDGMEINDSMSGVPRGLVNYESIEEVDVKTAGASAEYGNSRNAFMNIITKSGGNKFQGSALFQYQPESFNTTNVEAGVPSRISYAVPTITLSGPIMKDKLWFLASYKYDNENYVFPDTVVEPEIIRKTRVHLPYIKLTFQPSTKHTFSAVLSHGKIKYGNRGFPSTRYSTLATARNDEGGDGPTASATWRWIISDSTYFNFAAGYFIGHNNQYSKNQVPRERYTERFQGGSTLLYDAAFGEDYWSIRQSILLSGHLTYFLDNLWNTGSHEIKAGVDIRPYQHATRTRKYHEDELGFYRYRYGLDYENYGLSEPYVYRGYQQRGASGTPQDRYDNEVTVSIQNAYIQDKWLLSKNLTLHIGLRWEHQREYMHYREELPDALLAVYSKMQENVEFDDSGIAPRLGLTYNWENVGVFKFHFGRYFEYVGTGDYNNYARTITTDQYRMDKSDIGKGPEALKLYTYGTLSYNADYNENMEMEYNDEFVVSFERELVWNLAFDTTFVYRKSQITGEEDVNAVFENGNFVDRIFPDYNTIWRRTMYKGNDRRRSDDYKSLQFNLKRNFTGRWGMLVNYSFMWRNFKRLKFDPGEPDQFVYANPGDLSMKNFGNRWSFHASAFYRLPLDFMISTFIVGDSGEWINDTTGDYAWDDSAPRVTLSNGRKVDDIIWLAQNSYYVGKKFGESGRYTDALWSVNLRLSKGLRISRFRVEANIDFYNVFNWAAYRGFESSNIRRDYVDLGGRNRYQMQTSPQAPRSAQFSLRIAF